MDIYAKDASGFASIPLLKSVLNNDLTAVNQLIKEDPNLVNFVHGKSGDSVLLVAARYKRFEILELLMSLGADVEHRNKDLKRALHEAAGSGCVRCVRHLIKQGKVHINPLKRADWTPLMIACAKGHLDVIKELVECGADVKRVNKDGWNGFHLACREGDIEVLKYLTTIDSLLWWQCSNNRRTPFHTACMHGRLEAVEYLLQNCSFSKDEKDSCGTTPLMDAIRFGHIAVSKFLITSGNADIMQCDDLGRYIIHIAALSGQLPSVKYIVEELDIDVNSHCHTATSTALHFAAKEGHVDVVKYILQQGGDVNAADSNGRTSLHLAAAANKVDVVRVLMGDYCADASVVDVKGMVALQYAMTDAMKNVFLLKNE